MGDLRELACRKLRELLQAEAGNASVSVGIEPIDEYSAYVRCIGGRFEPFELHISVRLVEAGVTRVVYRLHCEAAGAARVVFFIWPADFLKYLNRYLRKEHITSVDLASGDQSDSE